MLTLIDQSNPELLRYRCDDCGMEGISTRNRASDDLAYFWVLTPKGPTPGRWVRHECVQEEEIVAVVPPRGRAKRISSAP